MSIPIQDFSVTKINNCRLCQDQQLNLVFDMGEHYVSSFVEDPKPSHPKAPLELYKCEQCELVQLGHTTTQELLYKKMYWYRSGVTQTMIQELEDITIHAQSLIDLEKGDIVIDIGSNDGTLLRHYDQRVTTIGVEPALNLADQGKMGLTHFVNDFWSYANIKAILKKRKAKVISAIGMLYDLDNPIAFVRDVEMALDDDGLFITQMMTLGDMVETRDIGNINHEHLEYYSLKNLNRLFQESDLKIIDITKRSINNQSTRIVCTKKSSKRQPTSRTRDELSRDETLTSSGELDNFFKTINLEKEKCLNFIKEQKTLGKEVMVYGASTKGNTILQFYGIDHKLIPYAAERSPEKWGLFTVGSSIQCISEQEAREKRPDFFLVLPYTFLEEMTKRENEWRSQGGRFIVPLPNFRVV